MTEYMKQRLETRIIRESFSDLPTVQCAEDAYILLKDLQNEMVEKFTVLFMDTRHRVLALVVMFSGGMTESVVDVRILIKTALDIGATTFLIAHNHPSGDPRPSAEDRAITTKIQQAAKLFDIRLLDHIIVGHEGYLSFGYEGILVL